MGAAFTSPLLASIAVLRLWVRVGFGMETHLPEEQPSQKGWHCGRAGAGRGVKGKADAAVAGSSAKETREWSPSLKISHVFLSCPPLDVPFDLGRVDCLGL